MSGEWCLWFDGCVHVFLCVFNQKFLVGGGSMCRGDRESGRLALYNRVPGFYGEIRIQRYVAVLYPGELISCVCSYVCGDSTNLSSYRKRLKTKDTLYTSTLNTNERQFPTTCYCMIKAGIANVK